MAKSKKSAEQVLAIWKPETQGEVLKGKFQQFQESPSGLFLVLDKGVINISTILRKLLMMVWKEMKKGDEIEIKYEGKAGRAKNFSVTYKGEVLRSAFEVKEAAEGNSVSSFFAADFEFPQQGEKKKGYKG